MAQFTAAHDEHPRAPIQSASASSSATDANSSVYMAAISLPCTYTHAWHLTDTTQRFRTHQQQCDKVGTGICV